MMPRKATSTLSPREFEYLSQPLETKQLLVSLANDYFPPSTFEQSLKEVYASLASPITRTINEMSFRNFILSHDSDVSDNQINAIFHMFDSMNQGTISLEEFIDIFTLTQSEISQVPSFPLPLEPIQSLSSRFESGNSDSYNNEMNEDTKIYFFESSKEINELDHYQEQILATPSFEFHSSNNSNNSSNNNNKYNEFQSKEPKNQAIMCVGSKMRISQTPISPPQIPKNNNPSIPIQKISVQQTRQNQANNNNNNNRIFPATTSTQKPTIEKQARHSFQLPKVNPIAKLTTVNQNKRYSASIPTRKHERLSITAAQSDRIISELINPLPAAIAAAAKPTSMNIIESPKSKRMSMKNPVATNHAIEHDILIRNLEAMRQLNAQDNETMQKQKESPLSQLLMKLAKLKEDHRNQKIDLFRVFKIFPSGKIMLFELIEFLKSLSIDVTKADETILWEQFFDKTTRVITAQDFIGLFCLYDVDILQNNGNSNPIFYEDDEEQTPQKKIIAMVKKQIREHYYFEIESEKLPGYLAFCSLFSQISKENRQFSDISFPATPDSIITDVKSRKYNRWRVYEWLRTSQFENGNQYVMFDKIQSVQSSRIGLGKLISPYDIQQGNLGDCYFLSAMSSLASEPYRILNLFVTQVMNPYGIYCVKICHDGIWKAVYVDDLIPCKNRRPAFTRSSLSEIWVCILEKAWAKLFRSYHNIESGFCREALRDLTGAPTQTIPTREYHEDIPSKHRPVNQKIPVILRDALASHSKFVVTAGADSQEIITESVADRYGLISSHAYSIIGIKEVNVDKNKKVTLLRMRNPWGRKEWTGDWSDNSSLWTQKLREELRVGYTKNDGIFYMSMVDFQKFFSDISICYYHDHYCYSSLSLPRQTSKRNNLKSQYSRLQIHQSGTYYISIVQKNRRTIEKEAYDYSVARLLIIEDKRRKCIGKLQKRDREIFIECKNLEPGSYWIQSKIFFDRSNELIDSYVVSCYGPASTELTQVQKQILPINLIPHAFLMLARENPERMTFSRAPDFLKCISLNLKDGFGYYYVINKGKLTMDLFIDFENSTGIKLLKPYYLDKCQFIVHPLQEIAIPIIISAKGYVYKGAEQYTIS